MQNIASHICEIHTSDTKQIPNLENNENKIFVYLPVIAFADHMLKWIFTV
ncbi:hypothetical protein EV198_1837 [Roseivirga ehrenbergii]|nr:hypothetical protein EV198_1837 [Roseivirga ehrenbergii]